ncbi:GtrA family protein [Nocardioides mangrovicus]|uniref:GtrA family protein n=1 Tax=Nocardioides mangrovicus TaxID=2478913 RepID=UPI0013145237|nr:GtrA family protein [Nocardioides mangrovicus]
MLRKLLTYAGGSLVATGCSALALALFYGVLHLSPGFSSVLAWLAGAVPNYWLNRAWTWQRRDRPDVRREVVPYVVIVLLTLALSALCTHVADSWLRAHGTSAAARVGLVDVVFVAVFVVMSLLRFVLLDRLFSRLPGQEKVSA